MSADGIREYYSRYQSSYGGADETRWKGGREVKCHVAPPSGYILKFWCPLADSSRISTVQIRAPYLKMIKGHVAPPSRYVVNYKLGERTSDAIGRICRELILSKFVRLIKQIRLIGVKGHVAPLAEMWETTNKVKE